MEDQFRHRNARRVGAVRCRHLCAVTPPGAPELAARPEKLHLTGRRGTGSASMPTTQGRHGRSLPSDQLAPWNNSPASGRGLRGGTPPRGRSGKACSPLSTAPTAPSCPETSAPRTRSARGVCPSSAGRAQAVRRPVRLSVCGRSEWAQRPHCIALTWRSTSRMRVLLSSTSLRTPHLSSFTSLSTWAFSAK